MKYEVLISESHIVQETMCFFRGEEIIGMTYNTYDKDWTLEKVLHVFIDTFEDQMGEYYISPIKHVSTGRHITIKFETLPTFLLDSDIDAHFDRIEACASIIDEDTMARCIPLDQVLPMAWEMQEAMGKHAANEFIQQTQRLNN